MHERYAMFALAACLLAGPVVADTNKPPPSDDDLAKEREARKASEQAYLERMEQRRLEEVARHPATQSKPKSASLERMLGRKRRYA